MASDDIVLITGSSGYLDEAIIRKLAGKYKLVGLNRPGGPAPPSPAHQIDLALGSDKAVREALELVEGRMPVGTRMPLWGLQLWMSRYFSTTNRGALHSSAP